LSKLNIIYEDDHLVIINKEAGMLTVADRFNIESVHLQSLLRKKYGDIFTVHRLDRETSGVICFAKDAETHQLLNEKFEHRDVEKYYFAIVEGNTPAEGEIDAPLVASETKPGTMVIHRKGKPSFTTYKTIKNFGLCSAVEVQIHTGRMHQIRVHFASIGHPLFIDTVYGRRENFKLSEIKGRKFRLGKFEEEEKPLISRLTLHSLKLVLDHPHTGEKMTFEAPLPKDMKALMKQLDNHGDKRPRQEFE
jgi:23S rRNA pseudouridine1911/1915/1917 synthase